MLLIYSGINNIDATGIEVLETIAHELELAGVQFYLSDVKGLVMDRLKAAEFDAAFLESNVFMSAHEAINWIVDQGSKRLNESGETSTQNECSNPVESTIHEHVKHTG